VKLIELLLCFKTANQGDVEHSFGIAIGNNGAASSAMLWVRVNWCQIADSLTEQCGHKTFQISGFWADYGKREVILDPPRLSYGPQLAAGKCNSLIRE
jgi:hypothetical protein